MKLTHGEKITLFESMENNTVNEFNEVFNENKLNYQLDSQVVIGQVLRTGHVIERELFVNDEKITHRFGIVPEIEIERDYYSQSKNPLLKLGTRIYKDYTVIAELFNIERKEVLDALNKGILQGKKFERYEK